MEKLEYIEFLKDEDAIKNMNKEYKKALDESESVTNICTIIEYMCDKRVAVKKELIAKLIDKLESHSQYAKYEKQLIKIKPDVDIDQKEYSFDFEMGKDFIKTLHKIESIEESIIMELEALTSFCKDKLVAELRTLILIKNLIIAYYLDNGTLYFQWR